MSVPVAANRVLYSLGGTSIEESPSFTADVEFVPGFGISMIMKTGLWSRVSKDQSGELAEAMVNGAISYLESAIGETFSGTREYVGSVESGPYPST